MNRQPHKQIPVDINGTICDIDVECVKMVQLFNNIGLTTKFSCKGDGFGDYEIMFADDITDEDIIKFLSKLSNKYDHSPFCGRFMKWGRKMSGNIKFNWVYRNIDYKHADIDYNTIIKLLNIK